MEKKLHREKKIYFFLFSFIFGIILVFPGMLRAQSNPEPFVLKKKDSPQSSPWFLRWIPEKKKKTGTSGKKNIQQTQPDRPCAVLEQDFSRCKQNNSLLNDQLATTISELENAKLELERLRKNLKALQNFVVAANLLTKEQIEELQDGNWELTLEKLLQTQGKPERSDFHEVTKGESLWSIAQKEYNNPYKWLLLYHANKDQIYDADLIYPGMVLIIPRY